MGVGDGRRSAGCLSAVVASRQPVVRFRGDEAEKSLVPICEANAHRASRTRTATLRPTTRRSSRPLPWPLRLDVQLA